MDRSVFLSDIDGTLVRGDVLPAPEVVQAADVFRAAGGLLSLCTGRSVEGARPVAESLSVDVYKRQKLHHEAFHAAVPV